MDITELTMEDEPGVYEIQVSNGRVYEVGLPESSVKPATLVISKEPNKPDSHEGREVLCLLEMRVVMGEEVTFLLDNGLEGMKQVSASIATSIARVCQTS